jgi:ABC-2 type transport system permease protein
MNRAGSLFLYECRRVLRSPVVWVVLAVLLIAGAWGALNTAGLHTDQRADLARLAEHEAAWYADIRARAARYAEPSSEVVPYWQDPTGASGFSRYFLRRFAGKPHLPLSMLAVGQSDIQPFVIPLRLETLFGGDPVYDFEPPRALATGRFDLSFLLVFVLPLCAGAIVATIAAHERDLGILPLVAAQPLSPRQWWVVRIGAVAIVTVPGIALCAVLALALAGAPVIDAPLETIAAAVLVGAHTLLWISLGGVCVVRGLSAVGTLSTVTAVWLVFTIATPLAGSFVLHAVSPPPSTAAHIDELRRTTDAVQVEADAIVQRRLAAHLGPGAGAVNPTTLDYATRLVLVTQEMEARLADQERRRQAHARAASRIAETASWLSPQVAFHTALAELAGTDAARHRAFLESVRAFQLELRGFMYPRVLETVRSTSPNTCNACPGRLTFTDYDAIPRFGWRDPPATVRVASALRAAGWLGVLAATLALVGIGGARTWALGS